MGGGGLRPFRRMRNRGGDRPEMVEDDTECRGQDQAAGRKDADGEMKALLIDDGIDHSHDQEPGEKDEREEAEEDGVMADAEPIAGRGGKLEPADRGPLAKPAEAGHGEKAEKAGTEEKEIPVPHPAGRRGEADIERDAPEDVDELPLEFLVRGAVGFGLGHTTSWREDGLGLAHDVSHSRQLGYYKGGARFQPLAPPGARVQG